MSRQQRPERPAASRWCVGVDRPPHVPDEPPDDTIPTESGPLHVCPACRARWETRP